MLFPDLAERFFSGEHPEWMDLPGLNPDDLAEDLLNLEKINRHFGGHDATRFILGHSATERRKIRTVLDCACGAGDLTKLLALSLPESRVTAIDLHGQTLSYARQKNSAVPVDWQQADIKKLPFADHSFDLVTCQLALHHFSESEAVLILRELKRVSKGCVFVTDLIRSRLGYFGIWILVHAWLRHPMTRHDALLSVRRAFTRPEMENMAEKAAWENFQACGLPWFRQAVWIG